MTAVLARFVLPDPEICDQPGLYVRTQGEARYRPGANGLHLAADARASFDTYFNAFGVGKWLRHTAVRQVTAALQVTGACRVELIHDRIGGRPVVVGTEVVKAEDPTWFSLALPDLDRLGSGAVYLSLSSTGDDVVLHAAQWETSDAPLRSVRLGLVITTFNRAGYVRASIGRVLEARARLKSDDASDIRIVVVDNGRNLVLDLPDGVPVTVLPTPNVGGAGGFARGLMHLREDKWATHVLFMDDDVTFDAEIVLRARTLLAYAADGELCISGSMLNDREPTVLFEAGSRFVGTAVHPLRALGGGLELLDWHDVLEAEIETDPIDYGAWWFFAFPITLTTDNPLPMFVRGDDVAWGLLHARQKIATFNGIGLWHQDFDAKNGPLAWFYDTRNFALVSVLAFEGYRWWHLARRYVTLCARSLLSFKYASAAEITFAIREFLEGPEHWLAIDHGEVHERVRALDGEKMEPLAPELLDVPDSLPRTGLSRYAGAVGALAVLGGHVLPTSWCRRPMVALHVQHRALLAAPLRTELLFRSVRRGEGFVARRDQRRFFTLLGEMMVTAGRIPLRFRRLRRAYRAAYPDLVSDEYWRRQFGSD